MDNQVETAVENEEAQTEAKGQTEETQAAEKPEETVPKERLDEISAELATQKEANALLQQNMTLLRANAPAQPKAPEFDIYKHVGLNPDDPDDIANQGQLKEIHKYNQGVIGAQAQHLRFLIDHPDYPELVGTDEQIQSGQFQEPFTEALKDAALLTMFKTSPTPQITAYVVAKLHQKNISKEKTTTTTEAKSAIDEAVANANKVKSVANTKGGGALSDEGRYESMSDQDFLELAASRGAQL